MRRPLFAPASLPIRSRWWPVVAPSLVPALAMLPFAVLAAVVAHIGGGPDFARTRVEEPMTATATRPTCTIVRPRTTYRGKQGFDYGAGISAESVGAAAICMHLLEIPPGGRARAHLHADHETAIYVLRGRAETWYGEELTECLVVEAGELLYIPAGLPHLPVNPSATEPAVAVLARTDPNEQESVVLRPDLDTLFLRRQNA